MDEPVEGTKIQRDLLDFFAIGRDMAFHLERMEQGRFATTDEYVDVQMSIHDLQHILANFDAYVARALARQEAENAVQRWHLEH